MDIVITYVNGGDSQWQKDYQTATKTPILTKRFRDWGTLRYLLRGIEKNMPFIRNVYLVVSGDSQVPDWVCRKHLNIVLHQDIIPAPLLPTFNSNTIEMHLHNIDGLDEEYLYFNDDFFPILPCKAEDFFSDGKGVIGMTTHYVAWDMYKKICRNSDRLARKASKAKVPLWFLRPQHICSPMLRSVCAHLYESQREQILSTITTTRSEKNVTQYLFLDYMYINGLLVNRAIDKKHFSTAFVTCAQLKRFFEAPTSKLVCINDVKLSDSRFCELKKVILEGFEGLFPQRSKYEK